MSVSNGAFAYIHANPFEHLGRPRTREWLDEHGVLWDVNSDVLPTIILGVYRRMSTLGQQTGYRQQSMIEDMTGVVLALGPSFGVIVFDEGNRSGQVLAKRKVALAMIRSLEQEVIDGIATPDAKRLSRDQYLGGGREIVQAVRKRKAMMVLGRGDIVNLRNYRERKQFERELRESSDEIAEIRQTFYSGWAARARWVAEGKVEPMWKGPAPYGYHHVDCLDEHGQVIRNRGVPRRTLAKFDEDAAGIARMIELFDTERTLNMVARKLNREGYGRRVHTGALSKGWTGQRLKAGFLENPLFYGVWKAIREKGSDLWDDFEEADLERAVPHLAYWTKEQADRWLTRLTGQPVTYRERTYDRPFASVLVCAGCGGPMVSAGRHGYRCRWENPQKQGIVSGLCETTQNLSAEQVAICLRGLFVENISRLAERVVDEYQRQRAEIEADPIADQLAMLDRQEDNLLALTRGRAPSEKAQRAYDDIQEHRAQLLEQQQRQRARTRLSEQQVDLLTLLRDEPGAIYDRMTANQQAEVWRLFDRKVRIVRTSGRGITAKYQAEILPESPNEASIWIVLSYVTQAA